MDVRSESMSRDLSASSVQDQVNGGAAGGSGHLVACALCHIFHSSDYGTGLLEPISICGDCNFLFLEDPETTLNDDYILRTRRLRRRMYRSFDSVENHFSRQFSHVINQGRQNQIVMPSELDSRSTDGDAAVMAVQHSSSRTTPAGSRRWRRVLSDPESDVVDSLYGDTESNYSFSEPRYFLGESDTVSYSAYGGDSDISVDGHGNYMRQDEISDPETDTDIDPMNAGLYQWNSDDPEEDNEDEEDIDWVETDAEDNTVASFRHGAEIHRSFNESEINIDSDWRQILSPQTEQTIHLGLPDRSQIGDRNSFANFEVAEVHDEFENLGDYLGARGFDELLEHLAETENSRRGAPPAAVSVVHNLPRMVIGDGHSKLDGLACAICKDTLSVGIVVNQLPCNHFYHPSCILPWLNMRNSCPICRYELLTDDLDYEDGKHRSNNTLGTNDTQEQEINENGSSDVTDAAEIDLGQNGTESGDLICGNIIRDNSRRAHSRKRWFFLAAAAPFVGIALVFCLGSPIIQRRWPSGNNGFSMLGWHSNHFSHSSPLAQRNNARSKRWWFPF